MNILVIGDVMLDRYLWGEISRISPEVPVPVCRLRETTHSLGGAANVARNLVNLGVNVSLVGVVGDDASGRTLTSLSSDTGIDTHLVVDKKRPTTVKTRVIGSSQHVVRIDEEVDDALSDAISRSFRSFITELLPKCDGVILSDYAKGVFSDDESCRWVISQAKKAGVPGFVDPKSADWSRYSGATCIKPNAKELREAAHREGLPTDDVSGAAKALRDKFSVDYILVTLGADGMRLVGKDRDDHFVNPSREVFDVSGAGDTVIATFTAAFCAGATPEESAHRANVAAGIVVGKVGTYPVSADELDVALGHSQHRTTKLCALDEALHRLALWRSDGNRIVFTNGCFDFLHAGHVLLFQEARKLGDRLIVAVNSDDSVRKVKGPPRPILPQKERLAILSAIEYIDMLLVFDEDEPLRLIELIRPDVLAKGSDYTLDEVVGGDVVDSYGGEVKLVPILEDMSVSTILDRLRKDGA